MFLLPYYCYSFETKLNRDEIKQRLEEITQIPIFPIFNMIYYTGYTGGLFQGEITKNDFRLKKPNPIPYLGIVPSPVLVLGEITENNNGSIIKVKFRLFYQVLLFWIVLIGGIFIGIISNIHSLNLKNENLSELLLFFLLFIFYGFNTIMSPFNQEVKRVKKIFEKHLIK